MQDIIFTGTKEMPDDTGCTLRSDVGCSSRKKIVSEKSNFWML
ncbi:MAG TPA: hypothetical protein PLN48_09550 [Lachnospiraceae bacterium]|nr:hypothetical protein [Lachnospiraceae bacterium]HUM84008.1 hypothetical protein [Lachnospiraceae bacterium]